MYFALSLRYHDQQPFEVHTERDKNAFTSACRVSALDYFVHELEALTKTFEQDGYVRYFISTYAEEEIKPNEPDTASKTPMCVDLLFRGDGTLMMMMMMMITAPIGGIKQGILGDRTTCSQLPTIKKTYWGQISVYTNRPNFGASHMGRIHAGLKGN
ncbi:hypothetical protein CRM22_001670 [Opisthorchis felineus]|uniref:Uncharacterized protein n=1 Tax=Opisthorchis felineus TaxID=147828 RepID=A0A4S2M9K9_OPIFE|nr:hypothetical protein CRM22_001670 [Opisthorchis felineus]